MEAQTFLNHKKHAEKQAIFLAIPKVSTEMSEFIPMMTHFKGTANVTRVELRHKIHVVIKAEQMHLPKLTTG